MTGGINYGGGHRTWLTIVGVCSNGAPLIYIGWRGGEAAKVAPQVGGILLGHLPIRPPPFPIPFRTRKGRGGRGNPIPFFLSSFPFPSPPWPAHMGGTPAIVAGAFPLLAHKAHIFCRGCPEPLPVTDKYPVLPGTLPVSEYYRPIYQSLPLGHFETPRHVRDLIWDFKQTSVHQNTKLIIQIVTER